MTTQPASSVMRDALVWLQEQMTQTRDLMGRLQRETEECSSQLASVQERMEELADTLRRTERRQDNTDRLGEEVEGSRRLAAQLQDKVTGLDLRQTEAERTQKIDLERDRELQIQLTQRVEQVLQLAAGLEQRLNVLRESVQQQQESGTGVRQDIDELHTVANALVSREATTSESLRRMEGALNVLDVRMATGEKAGETQGTRLQLVTDQSHRLEQRLELLTQRFTQVDQITEQIEVLRAERSRFESRVQSMEKKADETDTQVNEQAALAVRAQGRLQGVDERIALLQSEVATINEMLVSQMVRFGQTLERQKRRQIGDLEREIRELKLHAARLNEE